MSGGRCLDDVATVGDEVGRVSPLVLRVVGRSLGALGGRGGLSVGRDGTAATAVLAREILTTVGDEVGLGFGCVRCDVLGGVVGGDGVVGDIAPGGVSEVVV